MIGKGARQTRDIQTMGLEQTWCMRENDTVDGEWISRRELDY